MLPPLAFTALPLGTVPLLMVVRLLDRLPSWLVNCLEPVVQRADDHWQADSFGAHAGEELEFVHVTVQPLVPIFSGEQRR